jgi:GntR family transcriptional regulator/MocR family aminotransferase
MRHLKRIRAHYRQRQAFLIDLLTRRLHGLLEVRPVESGMYLTVWLPQDTVAALTQEGIVTMPLSALTLATSRPPGLVLGYSGHSEAAMALAVERMAKVFEPLNWYGRFPKLELQADQS